jgi:quinolinate synthase
MPVSFDRDRSGRSHLGHRRAILGHYYQRAELLQAAGFAGDSVRLSPVPCPWAARAATHAGHPAEAHPALAPRHVIHHITVAVETAPWARPALDQRLPPRAWQPSHAFLPCLCLPIP